MVIQRTDETYTGENTTGDFVICDHREKLSNHCDHREKLSNHCDHREKISG